MSTLVPLREQLNPLQDAFNLFMLTMPRHKLDELVQWVNSHESDEIRSLVEQAHDSSVVSGATASRSAAARRRGRGRPLRPLNSFIAFRSFYSTMFPEITQKAKSGILRFLWQNDPFKAKWAILAKAYSKIRDEHSGARGVCLETFLNLNAGYIGILEPSLYLEKMGWELTVDENHQYTMARVSHETINESDVSTNFSVSDIVNHCYDTGYVSRSGRQGREGHGNDAVMSFVAQPRSIVNQRNNVQVSGSNTVVENAEEAGATIESDNEERVEDTPTPAFTDSNSAVDGSSSIPIEEPSEQNNLRSMGGIGIELDLDLLAGSLADNAGNNDMGPIGNSTFDFQGSTYTTEMVHNMTMESFDFRSFIDF